MTSSWGERAYVKGSTFSLTDRFDLVFFWWWQRCRCMEAAALDRKRRHRSSGGQHWVRPWSSSRGQGSPPGTQGDIVLLTPNLEPASRAQCWPPASFPQLDQGTRQADQRPLRQPAADKAVNIPLFDRRPFSDRRETDKARKKDGQDWSFQRTKASSIEVSVTIIFCSRLNFTVH